MICLDLGPCRDVGILLDKKGIVYYFDNTVFFYITCIKGKTFIYFRLQYTSKNSVLIIDLLKFRKSKEKSLCSKITKRHILTQNQIEFQFFKVHSKNQFDFARAK